MNRAGAIVNSQEETSYCGRVLSPWTSSAQALERRSRYSRNASVEKIAAFPAAEKASTSTSMPLRGNERLIQVLSNPRLVRVVLWAVQSRLVDGLCQLGHETRDTSPILKAQATWYRRRPQCRSLETNGYSFIIFWQTSHGVGRHTDWFLWFLTSATEWLVNDNPSVRRLGTANSRRFRYFSLRSLGSVKLMGHASGFCPCWASGHDLQREPRWEASS